MKFLLVAAALAIPALAAPEPISPRATVKLNQYRTLDDCNNDRNILYHAAPISGTCYNLDSQTGAFFFNTGGFRGTKVYDQANCNGGYIGLYGGSCMSKDKWRSFRLS